MSELAKIDIKYLKGVGPKKADILKSELKVENVEDMLYVFPFRYVDRSKFYKISEVDSSMAYVQIKGKLQSIRTVGEGKSLRLSGIFTDGTSSVELVWFKGAKYIADQLKIGNEYVMFGKPNYYNNQLNFVHPPTSSVPDTSIMYPCRLPPFGSDTEPGFIYQTKESFPASSPIGTLSHAGTCV